MHTPLWQYIACNKAGEERVKSMTTSPFIKADVTRVTYCTGPPYQAHPYQTRTLTLLLGLVPRLPHSFMGYQSLVGAMCIKYREV